MEVQTSGACRYHHEIDMNSNSTQAIIVRLIGSGKRVLELGCATGYMSRVLHDRDCQIVAIEIDSPAAERASAFCDRIIVGDLDHMNLDSELGSDRFDVVVAADVLEHLKDPLSVLRAAKQFLKPDGYAVVCVPNIAHLSVRLALLAGGFPYGEKGLLDRTHLKFFTRESVEQLFDHAGFAIGHFQRIEIIPGDPVEFEVPYDPAVVSTTVLEALSRDPEASTYQFVLVGYPLPHAGFTFIQGRMKQLTHEIQSARSDLVNLRRQLEEAHQMNETNRTEISRLETIERKKEHEIAELRAEIERLAEQAAAARSENIDQQRRTEALIQESNTYHEDAARLQRLKIEAEGRLVVAREEAVRKQRRIDELTSSNEVSERKAAELRKSFEDQKQDLARLRAQVDVLSVREKDLREMLLDAHDQLLRRDDEITAMLATSLPQGTAPLQDSRTPAGSYLLYQQLVQRIRDVVHKSLPAGGKVLVISKGDDQLLRLDPCHGWHFPQREDGIYAGHYPANDDAAIMHLKKLREAGGQYLLIPQTALWWLDHYRALADYLNQHYTRAIDQPDVCVVFDLRKEQEIPSAWESQPGVTTPKQRLFGVNVSGHLRSEKGIGEGGRSTIRSLMEAGIPTALIDFSDSTSLNIEAKFTTFSDDNPYAINLLHTNPDGLPEFIKWKTEKYLQGHYNIGYWAWELSSFPRVWAPSFSLLDEVWVPSAFVLGSVSQVSPVPVLTIPHSLPELAISRDPSRSVFGLPKDKFLFLFMFDFMSIMERKNPLGLINAFKKAFKPRDNAMLVLKFSHAESYPVEWQALQQATKSPNIKVIHGVLSRTEINSLTNLCDCYVSLHRSEGFGLTLAEAMSLAKPVIATGYSGNMDFMTATNSFLVNHRLVTLDQDYPPYQKGSVWADPDQHHAAHLMRLVYEKRKIAREIGRQAQKDVREKLGASAVGAMIRQRFESLAAMGKISLPDAPLSDRDPVAVRPQGEKSEYRRLIRQMRKLIRVATPPGATVMVISRGDDELLKLEDREGWHFPRQEDGAYAGYYPSDSPAAIGQLELLHSQGGEFLLIPRTSLWWLEHYAEFREYIENRYRKVNGDENGILYQLSRNTNRSRGRIVHSPERTKRKVNGATHLDPMAPSA
jgi:2-polyprenyl-3-methyl-5-hydroxy-6-metoxy-1,4-benzoquinol methylase/glycosyltransferase involved in cell wall biosynthesis